MTNRIALILGLIIVTLIAYDLIVDDGRVLLFLARKMFVFLDWIAFWR
ncbi:MAG TPA: glyceraldehyde-3-phosphate dehydrogenase [Maritimibacter sp.]|nr:glyceraldehyde-3-phosphate dehydrogenase [Maritimibacter sp.]